MTEFMASRGTKLFPTKDWPEARKNELITELVAIVGRGAMCQIGTALPKHDWDAVMSAFVKKYLGTPLAVCVSLTLRTALRWLPADLEPAERVRTVFDQGSPSAERQILWAFNGEKGIRETRHNDYRLGSLRFDDKRQCPPLQAADIPALLHYQAIRDKDHEQGRIREVYATLARRLGEKNVKMRFMDEEALRSHVANLKKAGLF